MKLGDEINLACVSLLCLLWCFRNPVYSSGIYSFFKYGLKCLAILLSLSPEGWDNWCESHGWHSFQTRIFPFFSCYFVSVPPPHTSFFFNHYQGYRRRLARLCGASLCCASHWELHRQLLVSPCLTRVWILFSPEHWDHWGGIERRDTGRATSSTCHGGLLLVSSWTHGQ